jgi:GrpB-like predicted nucleotidyltransferase (UPF0157 family)
MTDEAVTLSDPDPLWARRFEATQAELTPILAPWLAADLEHVGSTAVPGLVAKPIIDILAPVVSLAEASAAVDPLASAGWLFWPDDPNRASRLWFLHPRPEARTHHLHLVQHDHPEARAMVAVRDALRADAALRASYADLKRRLASEHAENRNAYTNGKAYFVASTLRELGLHPPALEQLPE